MNKLIIGAVLASTFLLGACSAEEPEEPKEVKASVPSGYERVASDEFYADNDVSVIMHKETKCYYTLASGSYDTTVSITQMFVKENGVSVPYCEK
ncbi:hypothetical protein AB3N02_21800 [Priestia aryabhattai]|uniref:hypothetical protein n=1 Tax=Priestia aryabhattai TaxID=412384 RepID=UPI0039A103E3